MNGDDDEDNLTWLFRELLLTAERAQEQGLSPGEFLLGLRAYARRFEEDYTENVGE